MTVHTFGDASSMYLFVPSVLPAYSDLFDPNTRLCHIRFRFACKRGGKQKEYSVWIFRSKEACQHAADQTSLVSIRAPLYPSYLCQLAQQPSISAGVHAQIDCTTKSFQCTRCDQSWTTIQSQHFLPFCQNTVKLKVINFLRICAENLHLDSVILLQQEPIWNNQRSTFLQSFSSFTHWCAPLDKLRTDVVISAVGQKDDFSRN